MTFVGENKNTSELGYYRDARALGNLGEVRGFEPKFVENCAPQKKERRRQKKGDGAVRISISMRAVTN